MSEEPLPQGWLSKVMRVARRDSGNTVCAFLIILLLTLFLFAGAFSSFWLQYQTNDDVAMNMYAAGKGLGQPPSEFLLFQHFIIGLALKFAYTHLPQIPWYGTLTYAYLFMSSLTAGYAILRLNPTFGPAGLSIVPLILFYLQVIVSPQFTMCAGYLAIAGILLLYSTIYKPSLSRKANLCLLTIASGLLILAGLVRFYGLMLALLLMAPLYLYLLVTRFAAALRRLLPMLCCVVFVSVLLNWGQQAYYAHSSGWERFYAYNNVRADFMDRHKVTWDENTKPLFQQIGWTRNDLAMLTSWFYLDAKVYSFGNLVFISQHASLLPRQKVTWSKLFADLKKSFSSYGGIATLFLCALLLAKGDRITKSFALLALLWCSTLFAGINIVERHLPLRVWLVMVFGLYTTAAALWCRSCEERTGRPSTDINRGLSKGVLSVLIAAFYTACCWGQIRLVGNISHIHESMQKRFRKDLAQLQPRADQLFVTWGGGFPYEEFQLPTQAGPVSSKMQLLGLGVGNHEPFVQNRLRSFKIDDLYQSFYTREDIFLICNEREKKLLTEYIEEHYQTKVEVRTVLKGMTFTVNKVIKVI